MQPALDLEPFATARMMSRPPSRCVSASAKATGTVGETACVGGLHIGSKSSTCVATELMYAACVTATRVRVPQTEACGAPPSESICAVMMCTGGSRPPASATATPSLMARLTSETHASPSDS